MTTVSAPSRKPRGRRGASAMLWLLAFVLMLAAASYQRRTGPTYEMRGVAEIAGESVAYALPRSGTTGHDLVVSAPDFSAIDGGFLHWRRYPGGDPFIRVELTRIDERWTAAIPSQPPAGKVEYTLDLHVANGSRVTIPPDAQAPVLRFKDRVPLGVLIPHIAMMFLSMGVGVRAALAGLLGRDEVRRLIPVTAVGLTVGGLILGPIVQKYAFGAFWTGWPFGGDLTDNKTLVMWGVWVVAALVVPRLRDLRAWPARTIVVLAAAVMLAVYVIPHSLRGSELDYDALDAGTTAEDAIRTGRSEDSP